MSYEPTVLNGSARETPVYLKFKNFFDLGELLEGRLKSIEGPSMMNFNATYI
jgi:hypothetical protein